MKKFNQAQLKGIAQFLNALSVAWFTGGVITPVFASEFQNPILVFILMLSAILLSIVLLVLSLIILRKVKS